jgi:hypothetical protein
MNWLPSSETLANLAKVTLLLVLAVSSIGTALVVLSLGMPEPPGVFRFCLNFEIGVMAVLLNFGLPLGILAVGTLAWMTIRAKAFDGFSITLPILALVGVFASSVAACVAIDAYGVDFWSRIWWKISL